MQKPVVIILIVALAGLVQCQDRLSCKQTGDCTVNIPDSVLRETLTPIQYYVTQQMGTERQWTGKHLNNKEVGVYSCVVCGNEMYTSSTKYDSKSGWPSFYDVIGFDRVRLVDDFSNGMQRIEVACAKCGAHHGHVFNDGPLPTGKRYCINSAAMKFTPAGKAMTPVL